MWPTDQTLPALLSGFVPIGYTLWVAARKDVRELVSLRFIAVLATWYAFHVNGWLGYIMGHVWDSHMVILPYIDHGIWFSSLCMMAIVVGYDLFQYYWKKREASRPEPLHIRPPRMIIIELKWLTVLTVIFLVSFVWFVGGPAEAWRSSTARLNPEYDLLTRTVGVVVPLLGYILMVLIAVYFFQESEEKQTQHYVLAGLLLILASTERIYIFSRSAGQAFMILAIIALAMQGRRAIPIVLACIIGVYWFGSIGLNARGNYNPGVGNFLEAMVSPERRANTAPMEFGDQSLNLAQWADNNYNNALDPFTLKIHSRADDRFTDENVFRFFWNLHPAPSAVLPTYPIGEDLTVIVGTVGISGVTTPMMATVFYVFGYLGALFYVFLGAVYGLFNTLAFERRTPTTILCWLMGFVGIGIGLHSDVRASTRSLIYAGFFYLMLEAWKWLRARYRDQAFEDTVPKELHRRSSLQPPSTEA